MDSFYFKHLHPLNHLHDLHRWHNQDRWHNLHRWHKLYCWQHWYQLHNFYILTCAIFTGGHQLLNSAAIWLYVTHFSILISTLKFKLAALYFKISALAYINIPFLKHITSSSLVVHCLLWQKFVLPQNNKSILPVATLSIALYVFRRSMSDSDVEPEVAILSSTL